MLLLFQVTLEELADRVNGDIRMALNQLQYMSLSMSTIKYDDIRQRLLNSAKDEDISPFTAVDKYGFSSHNSDFYFSLVCFLLLMLFNTDFMVDACHYSQFCPLNCMFLVSYVAS